MDAIEEIRAEWKRIGDEVKAPLIEIREAHRGLQAQVLDLQQKGARASHPHNGESLDGGSGINFGQLFADAGVDALASGKSKNTVTLQLPGGIGLLTKAAVTTVSLPGQPQRLPQTQWGNDARRQLRLLDVLPTVPMTSGSAQYLRLGAYANVADFQVLEGDLKAEAALPTSLITVAASTVAHWLPLSTQVLADNDGLQQQISNLLLHGVLQKLEAEIVGGAGLPGGISGLTVAAATFAPTAGLSPADRIGEAAAALQALGWQPNAVIMSPASWFAIASAHTTNGEYTSPYGWFQPPRLNLWNLDVIITPSAPPASVIVLDTSQIAILDRQSAQVDLGWVADQFARNLLSMRCELRAALAIYSPSALAEVSLV
jgi:hypothetical protein